MKMKEIINRIANGVYSGADTRAESVALLEEAVSKVVLELAGAERIEDVTALAAEYGFAFEVSAGQLTGVVFE